QEFTFDDLFGGNPEAYTFAVDLPTSMPGGPHDPVTFLGASPELLVALRDGRITVNPLAGTRPRHPEPGTDRELAGELMGSAKDRHEHHLVVEHITRRLAPLCDRLEVPDEPELLGTSDAWHLSTVIRATPADPGITSLRLAQAMHPTPAVCGTPTDAAAGLIRGIESVERGWYAGAVGWCDARGDGEWVVALRCALVWQHRARLYAGVGVVPGSDPHDELAETSTKFRTALFGLGFEPPAR
ncbi:MAG: isochorismate synthase, partial [Propionibacteriaceae bacterium]|nr:isochorismate synthase [Propionibacteriaceae bacterium]